MFRLRSTPNGREVGQRQNNNESSAPPPPDLQPAYVGERLQCAEGGAARVQWKNIYLFPEHRRYRLKYADIRFAVTNPPAHGQLLVRNESRQEFNYEDVINQAVLYQHDGSESTEDSADLQVWIEEDSFRPAGPPHTLTLPVRVDPVDDPTFLRETAAGQNINMTPSAR